MTDFQSFMRQRDEAAAAYCQGDAAPVNALLTQHHPVSFFGPDGTSLQGAEMIRAAFTQGASAFGADGESRLDIIQSGGDGEIGYWCGHQHAEVTMDGKKISMTLRITEVFRRESGQWRLFHRHADAAKKD